jgi:hypothetical protein
MTDATVTDSTVDDCTVGLDAPSVEPAACTWTAHPLRDEPLWKSVALVLSMAGASALMAVSFGQVAVGVVALAVLTGSMARYLLPTRYSLDESGAAWRLLTWRRRPWSTFRRAVRHADGVFLSPFSRPHRLDSFRGLFLRTGETVDARQLHVLICRRLPSSGDRVAD